MISFIFLLLAVANAADHLAFYVEDNEDLYIWYVNFGECYAFYDSFCFITGQCDKFMGYLKVTYNSETNKFIMTMYKENTCENEFESMTDTVNAVK